MPSQRNSSRRPDERNDDDQNPSVRTNDPSVASDRTTERGPTSGRRGGPQNGFWQIAWDVILREGVCVCKTCGALTIASDKSMNLHRGSHP
jgi:hypothetical protein